MAHKCETCQKEFSTKTNLVKHLKKKTKCISPEFYSESYNPDTDINNCEFCGNHFLSQSGLSRHRHKTCKKSPYVQKIDASTKSMTIDNSHNTTENHTQSHNITINQINQYYIIYDKKIAIEDLRKMDPSKKSTHEYIREIFPQVQNYTGNEDINHILDDKTIKKIFNRDRYSKLVNS